MLDQFGIWPVDGGLYAQDPDFIYELQLARTARNDHDLLSIDAKDNSELKKQQAKRRAQIVKWRERVKRGK